MEQRREQFECSYCGKKFNFKKDAAAHEAQCPERKDLSAEAEEKR
jgi:hypothetical protein